MLTNEHLEALATVHLHPQTQAGGEVDLMPLLRAVEAASRADERERCAIAGGAAANAGMYGADVAAAIRGA